MNKVDSIQLDRFENGISSRVPDLIVKEEPLEIRLGFGPEDNRGQLNLAVTMRTPGDDENLVLGFLFGEGIIAKISDVLSIKPCTDKQTQKLNDNILRVELHPELAFTPERFQRNFYTSSSCGVCGKASIEAISTKCNLKITSSLPVDASYVGSLPDKLLSDQLVFSHTGGLHATAIFSGHHEQQVIMEDVGRHNAFDKAVGYMLKKKAVPLSDVYALVSGRVSFEIVQKAAMAGIPLLFSIGAPSSLAVELAGEFNITLVGFVKKDRFNVYCHPERIVQ